MCFPLLALSALSCGKADPGVALAPASASPPSSSATALDPELPPPRTTRKTTSGQIAIGNLGAQIDGLEAQRSAQDPGGKRLRLLVELHALRADMAGRISDLERAAELADALPFLNRNESSPGVDPGFEDHLVRAGIRAALHRWDDAWADLDLAERRGAPGARTLAARASILEARGKLDEALALAEQARKTSPSIDTIGLHAVLLGELDRRDDALAAFRQAFESYGDTSPFPVAWLFFRKGQLWEREGRRDLAVAHYRAALERVPTYAHAAAHLARLLPASEAEQVLAPFDGKSDDPDILAVLAMKLDERGDKALARAQAERAAARYDELVARHPAAFADHAAQFWLDAGGDPGRALALAKVNLGVRKTPRAYQLAVVAALSAGDRKAACDLGTEGLGLPRVPSMLKDVVKSACQGP